MINLKSQGILWFMGNKSDVIKQCSNWYQTLTGQSALVNTEVLCAKTMSEIFGYYAIQIGMLSGECDLLKHSRINASFTLANPDNLPDFNKEKAEAGDEDKSNSLDYAVIATNEKLPISTDNIDLVVASHVLEMSKNPHQVLREIDRVLVPEGHCILIGFNPFALSNLNIPSRFKRKNRHTESQDTHKMRSAARVKDWFSLLGFEILEVNYMGFRPALKNQKIFKSLSWMEHWGEYAGPLLGSMYVVHAKKQVASMRPNKKVWRAPALLEGGKVALNRTAQKVRRNNYSN